MDYLVQFFAWLMEWCHSWCPNWWADIVIFTFFTKILQFPVSLWCQVNSLKMVSLMPFENRIRMEHYGDRDAIGEETAALYRREHYHPLLSLVPLAINIIILMAFVKVIYGIGDKLTVPGMAKPLIACVPMTDGGLAWAMPVFAGAAAWLLGFSQNIFNPLQHEQTRAQQLTTNGISICISLFLGMFVAAGVGLYWATSNVFSILVQWGENLCIPPKKHVDYPKLRRSQAELRKFEASLKAKEVVSPEDKRREKEDYKRFFKVANKHVVFYAEGGGYYKYFQSVIEWLLAHSNVVIHYVTNDPRDAIFDRVEGQRSKVKGREEGQGERSRSTEDDKFHCLTSDLGPLTSNQISRIRAYYIGPTKIIPLMMKMDADMVVMTTPDLNTYHIKRSYVKKDVEYVYLDHGPTSVHMCYRKGAFDHFDTIMCNGPFQVAEHRATEQLYHLKAKKLVESGYPLLDTLEREGRRSEVEGREEGQGERSRSTADDKFHCQSSTSSLQSSAPCAARIMIANSHQKDNVFDSCLDELIAAIGRIGQGERSRSTVEGRKEGQRSKVKGQTKEFDHLCLTSDLGPLTSSPTSDLKPLTSHLGPLTVVLRPHPQYVRRFPARWQAIKEKYSGQRSRVIGQEEGQRLKVKGLEEGQGERSRSTEDDKFHCLTSDLGPLTLIFEDDFSKPSTMDQSDVLITDWSGIAYEFAYKTRRPTLFVDTPMKVINPEWKKIGLTPTDISFRNEVGVSVDLEVVKEEGQRSKVKGLEEGQRSKVKGQTKEFDHLCLTSDLGPLTSSPTSDLGPLTSALADMLARPDAFAAKIDAMFAKNFFNPGHAGEAVGSYILDSLIARKK